MRLRNFINHLEEGIIGVLLAAMTLLTFSQVVARYFFNSGAVWALEATTTLFAWLILFGVSYGVKIGAHLGVDIIARKLPGKLQRAAAATAAVLCILYAVILLDASWLGVFSDRLNARGGAVDYIVKMHRLGIEMEDLPIPRYLAYSILPVGLALFALRSIQALWQILRGDRAGIIANFDGAELDGAEFADAKLQTAADAMQTSQPPTRDR